MQKKLVLAVGSMTAIIAAMSLTLTQVRSVRSGPRELTPTPCGGEAYSGTPTPTPNALTPIGPALLPVIPTAIQPEVVDLAPDIPYEDKPSVVVQHPDCSRTMYLVPPDMLDAFIENIPEEDKFLGDIPPPSMLGPHEPPTPEPE